MAKRLMAIPLALALTLGVQTTVFAQADMMMHTGDSVRIADLPSGHWATNATQVAVANNIIALENGRFNGQMDITRDELRHAMEALTNTAENIAGKGALTDLRASIGVLPTGDQAITRMELAQVLGRFLDAAANQNLLAIGAPRSDSASLKDVKGHAAIQKVVDRYKVMTGYPDNTFRPSDEVTRYQMAAIALHILRDMQESPVAQAAPQPVVVEPQPPTVVVVPGEEEEEPIAAVPTMPEEFNHRERTPINVSWQALNQNNLQLGAAQGGAFNTIPGSLTLTGYQGPLMLQAANNFLVNVYQSNTLNSELRLGYSDLKLGIVQLIPFVGATLGFHTAPGYNYTGYAGVNYGGILSVWPMDNLEIFGHFSQSPLLGSGRWNSNFQPTNYPNAVGAALSNYGLGADFYVSPNIALSVGVNAFQVPAQIGTANALTAGGVNNVLGGNIGLGFGF